MGRLITRAIVPALVVGIAAAGVFAGIRTRTGKERGFWSIDSPVNYSVVYADVVSVKQTEAGPVALVLDVRATLTGMYDAAARPVLGTELRYGFKTSAIRRPPAAKAHVVVVLEHSRDGQYYVASDYMLFMPGAAGLVEVANFDDPKVATIISRLREVRSAKPQEGPDLDEIKRGMERARKEAAEQ